MKVELTDKELSLIQAAICGFVVYSKAEVKKYIENKDVSDVQVSEFNKTENDYYNLIDKIEKYRFGDK